MRAPEIVSRLAVLAAMLAAAAGLWHLASREDVRSAPRPASGLLYPGLEPRSVGELTLGLRNGLLVSFARTAGGLWRITEPGPEVARAELVEVVLDDLARAQVQPLEGEGRGLRADQVGLEPPRHSIRFGGDGWRETLLLGEVEPLGRMVYARRAGSDEIVLATRNLVTHLQGHGGDFVDRSLLRGIAGPPDMVRLTGPEGVRLEAARSGDAWTITRPIQGAGDASRITGLIRSLQFAQHGRVLSPDTRPQAVEAVGLPDAESRREGRVDKGLLVEVGAPGEHPVRLWIQGGWEEASEDVAILRDDLPKIVAVPRAALNPLVNTVGAFRDPRLLPPVRERVESLRVGRGGATLLDIRRQADGSWRFHEPQRLVGEAVETERHLGRSPLGDLLGRIDRLEAIAFLPPPQGEPRGEIAVVWTQAGLRRLDRIEIHEPIEAGVPATSTARRGEGFVLAPDALDLLDPLLADRLRGLSPLQVDETRWLRWEARLPDRPEPLAIERAAPDAPWTGDDAWSRRYALARDMLRGLRGMRWDSAREDAVYPWAVRFLDGEGAVLAEIALRLPGPGEEAEVEGTASARAAVAGRPGVELVLGRELIDRLEPLDEPLVRQP